MRQIDEAEAASRSWKILQEVGQGEGILITRNGTSIARLVPILRTVVATEAEAAMARIRTRAESLKHGPFNWEKWKSERDFDRR